MKPGDQAWRRWIYPACRWLVGGIFVYASWSKIGHPSEFAEIIYNYKILPTGLINLAALVLPMVELLAGGLLIAGVWPGPAAGILTALILVFIGAIGFNLARGLDFSCGCFSTSRDVALAGWTTLVRDLALLPPAMVCLLGAGKAAAGRAG